MQRRDAENAEESAEAQCHGRARGGRGREARECDFDAEARRRGDKRGGAAKSKRGRARRQRRMVAFGAERARFPERRCKRVECGEERGRGRIDGDPLMRVSTFLFAALLLTLNLPAQDADPGRLVFEGRCARCHGADGNGGELGPAIRGRLAGRTNEQLATLIRAGLRGQGMPPSQIGDAEMEPLTRFLRGLQPREARREAVREKLPTTDGKTLEWEILNQIGSTSWR